MFSTIQKIAQQLSPQELQHLEQFYQLKYSSPLIDSSDDFIAYLQSLDSPDLSLNDVCENYIKRQKNRQDILNSLECRRIKENGHQLENEIIRRILSQYSKIERKRISANVRRNVYQTPELYMHVFDQ